MSLIDNDLGPDAGECIGIALGINTTLKGLKVSENALKTEGALAIIKNAGKLQHLYIGKYVLPLPRHRNSMKAEAAKELANLLRTTDKLHKLSTDFNELGPAGTNILAKVGKELRDRG